MSKKEINEGLELRQRLATLIELRTLVKGKESTLFFVEEAFRESLGCSILEYHQKYNFGYTKEFRQKLFNHFEKQITEVMVANAPNMANVINLMKIENRERNADFLIRTFINMMETSPQDTVISASTSASDDGVKIIIALILSKALEDYIDKRIEPEQLVMLLTNTHVPPYWAEHWEKDVNKDE